MGNDFQNGISFQDMFHRVFCRRKLEEFHHWCTDIAFNEGQSLKHKDSATYMFISVHYYEGFYLLYDDVYKMNNGRIIERLND